MSIKVSRRDFLSYSLGIITGVPLFLGGLSALNFVLRKTSSIAGRYGDHSGFDYYIDTARILNTPGYGTESLEDLSRSLYTGQMDKKLSRLNIENSLVSIIEVDGKTDKLKRNYWPIGTGFLITQDGFVLTAYHCVENYVKEWEEKNQEDTHSDDNFLGIFLQNGYGYRVNTSFMAADPNHDIALIKAEDYSSSRPVRFMTSQQDLILNQEVRLFAMIDKKQYHQLGRVIFQSLNTKPMPYHRNDYNTFLTDAYGEPGFSGGVFTTADSKFAGLALYIVKNEYENYGYAGGAHIHCIRNLVNNSTAMLKKILE